MLSMAIGKHPSTVGTSVTFGMVTAAVDELV